MNNAGLDILDVVVIGKGEVKLKSTNMEKEGFVRGLKSLQKDESRDRSKCTFSNYKASEYVISFVFIFF